MKKDRLAHHEHISLTNDELTFSAGVAVASDGAVYVVSGSTYVEVGAAKSFDLPVTEAGCVERFGGEHK